MLLSTANCSISSRKRRCANNFPVNPALSPDGKLMAGSTADGTQNEIGIWDFGSQKPRLRIKMPSHVMRMVFSPDGTRLAVVTDRVELWDTSRGVTIWKWLDVVCFEFQRLRRATVLGLGPR
ncbi:MAG: hypothetical protein DMD91_30815 [Candidatus Rokuibacteriota bacterium]|nr:MAG: hypothetical protein DMD91_30815 [Candidatus Rokubacteria bacterium]